jgi:glycosyltransferase involved in cell wall biosynthesis
MQPPKFWYSYQNYDSHSRVAEVYKAILRSGYELVTRAEDSDFVVLHYEPRYFRSLFEALPCLTRKYVIGYCVWEASVLPQQYEQPLSLVDEVWTCSRYCEQAFRPHHKHVTYIPHVIERDVSFRQSDLVLLKRLISHDSLGMYYLTIARLWDKRKNTGGLIEVFKSLRSRMPAARLIVKCSPDDQVPASNDMSVIYLPLTLSRSQLNALYHLCDVYVSGHHAEGWGLTMSDAMLFRKPIIASGYSGNLEFMNDSNSWLLECEERNIEVSDCYGLFVPEMKWGYPSKTALQECFLQLYEGRDDSVIQARVENASLSTNNFSRLSIADRMQRRIAEITGFSTPPL